MSASSGARVLAFAGFRLDPARRRLTGPDGAAVPLQPRVFDLLSLFLGHPGELLSKQAIMDAVWPDTHVDENNLNQAVSTLRRALGESAGEPRFIATVPRRGYQLIVPVEAVEAAENAAPAGSGGGRWLVRMTAKARAAWPLLATAAAILVIALLGVVGARGPFAATRASIAVLPFEDMSAAGDQAYFADGVAQEILDELARLEGLKVAGRLSSIAAAQTTQDPRAIGRALGVAHVLVGGVRKEGDRLRVTAELVSTTDGFQLWSQTYDRQIDDVFAIQDEIAASVAETLSVTLGVARARAGSDTRSGTRSVDAYDHYLRGRAYWAQSGIPALLAAIEEYRRAVAIDPEFGEAWASMARAADALRVQDPMREAEFRALQEEATARARAAAPERWEAVALEARLLMRELDWAGAAEALEEAGRLASPTPVEKAEIEGAFLLQVGRAAEAKAVFEAARETDPLSFTLSASVAWALDLTGDLNGALAEYAHAQTLPSDDTAWAFQHLMRLMRLGDDDAIGAAFARYPYAEDGTDIVLRRIAANWWSPDTAFEAIRTAVGDGSIRGPYRMDALALLAAHYGDPDLAIALFREEYFHRNGGATVHLWHPAMAQARRTDGFKALVRDLGFVDYWRASGAWSDFCRPLGADDFECF